MDIGTFYVLTYGSMFSIIVQIAIARQQYFEANIHTKIKFMCLYTVFSVFAVMLLVAGAVVLYTYDPVN